MGYNHHLATYVAWIQLNVVMMILKAMLVHASMYKILETAPL